MFVVTQQQVERVQAIKPGQVRILRFDSLHGETTIVCFDARLSG